MNKLQRQFALLATLLASTLAGAQSLPRLNSLNNMTPSVSLVSPSMITPITPAKPPCARPAEAFDIDDYSGPLSKLVSRFSQRIESTTVHIPRHRSDLRPCALTASDKFHMFVESTADPINYLGAAWDAATAQLDRDDPSYRQGMSGYGKRFGAATLDNATGDFFGIFLYPALFRQDPRYYRLGQGSTQARLGHALAHRFVTRGDSGRRMPNYSEWFGTVSSKALSNLYHPGNPRGFGPTASRVGFSVANDMAWDAVREFWPEIAKKFRLPFRTRKEPFAMNAPPKRSPVQGAILAQNAPPSADAVD
jgi:hypothetical protein